jgi:hypothetical protein
MRRKASGLEAGAIGVALASASDQAEQQGADPHDQNKAFLDHVVG